MVRSAAIWAGDDACVVELVLVEMRLGDAACWGDGVDAASSASRSAAFTIKLLPTGAE